MELDKDKVKESEETEETKETETPVQKEEPEKTVVDHFIDGNMDEVKAAIHHKVVSVVRDSIK